MKSATLGGAGWRRDTDDLRLNLMNRLADSLDSGRGIGPLIEYLTPAGQPKPSEEKLKLMNDMVLLMNDPKALAAVIRGMPGLVVPEEKLRANKVPTLALIGEIDPLKESVDALAEVMPNLEVIVVNGADHMNAPTRPEFINGLKEFLAAHCDAPVKSKPSQQKLPEPAVAQ